MKKTFDIYRNENGSAKGLRLAFGLLTLSVVIGVTGFMVIERYNFIEAVYMTIITLSTVGFSEVKPLTHAGRIFASAYIISNIGIYAYAATAFSRYIIEGEVFKKRYIRNMENKIKKLRDHVIVCGFGKYGVEICQHFDAQNQTFVVIELDEAALESAKKKFKNLHWIVGDATSDDILSRANIKNAKSIIAATGDDSENIFIILSARQLNPTLDIISRANDRRSEPKMYLAGANHVIMPDQIGGFYMAVLVSKPDVVDFFSFIANETNTDITFDEIHFEEFAPEKQYKPLRDLEIRQRAGANVIGLRKKDGSFIANPTPDTVLQPGESYIVIGTKNQIEKLADCLKP